MSAAAIASNLSVSSRKPRVANALVLGDRQQRVPDQDQRELAGRILQVALEELEQLVAALVLIDAADVDRERSADVVFLAEAGALRIVGHLRSDADDDSGNGFVA